MAALAKAQAPLSVALLGRADDARALLRRALEDLGAQVVFEGDPAGLQSEQVLKSTPQVVLVNLASGVEDDIDHLQPLFDSPNVNVVFNEADVSSQLAGWDLARWARHLAAKVMGHETTIPPPPPGSEPLPLRNFMPVPGAPPTPAQMSVERPIEEFMIEAEDRVDGVPSNHLPYASGRRAPVLDEPAPDFKIDVSELEGALSQIGGGAAVELTGTAVPEREQPAIVVLEDDAAEFDVGLDMLALDAALELDQAPAKSSAAKTDAELLDETLAGLDLDFDAEDVDSVAVDESDGESILDEFVSVESVSFGDDGLDLDDHDASDSGMIDADIAALAAQLDALDAGPMHGDAVKGLEFTDFSDAPTAAAPASRSDVKVAPAAPAAVKKPSFGNLDLTPMDDGESAPASSTTPAKASPAYDFSSLNFSLETHADESDTTAAPAATPAPTKSPPQYDFSGLDLSLEPVADDTEGTPVAPVKPASTMDALMAAMDLAPAAATKTVEAKSAPGTIERVVVLGASIGGPDALRSFLGGIPEGFPALFLLVQHLESGFFERLAQQLQKSTKLPVRVADAGRTALAGEVLVVPAQQRMQVEPNGAITFGAHAAPPKYTPCIDEVLRDIADRFGANATAIIFSGMAGDAIEGAVYLTTQGGEVWAQDPASCVVSSMVDGARARGVVEFVGSPRELAERCVAQYGNA